MKLGVVLRSKAAKDLRGLPEADRERIVHRLKQFASTPTSPQHDVKRLAGTADLMRLRVGDWRVIFVLDSESVDVMRVLHRREAYR